MEGRRCGDVIWGEKDHRCCGGEGALITESVQKNRGRQTAVHRGLHKKSTSPKPVTGKTRRVDCRELLQRVELKNQSFTSLHRGRCRVWWAQQGSCGVGQEPGSTWHDWRIPWDALEATVSPSWCASGKGSMTSQGKREPVDVIVLPFLSIGAETPAEGS